MGGIVAKLVCDFGANGLKPRLLTFGIGNYDCKKRA